MKESDHREQFLVERLHHSETYVPALSLVAETTEKQIVGYILLTEVKIDSDTQSVTSLSVAPLAVLPEFQRKGIGGDVDSVSPSEGSTFGLRHSSRIGA